MSTKLKTIAFWGTTILGPTSFVIGGVIGLMNGPEVVTSTHRVAVHAAAIAA